jgi:hypothetical protein
MTFGKIQSKDKKVWATKKRIRIALCMGWYAQKIDIGAGTCI